MARVASISLSLWLQATEFWWKRKVEKSKIIVVLAKVLVPFFLFTHLLLAFVNKTH